jgi:CRISPR/Cas system Type II protein with McrA/HNH and RuvC-like nuclease domain
MQWFIILLLASFSVNSAFACDAIPNSYKEGATFYVWVANLNLRQQPSPSAPVIKKLIYGTPVEILKQDEKPVPYKLPFFSYKDTAAAIPKDGIQNQVVLDGEWIKVKTAQQEEGYIINKLLLDIEPMKFTEGVTDYFVRVFQLTKHEKKTIKQKDKECPNHVDNIAYETFTSNINKVLLKTEENKDAYCGGYYTSNTKISIPEFSFEKAFVFFNKIMPPEINDFEYKADELFSYALDQVPNEVILKKAECGVDFEWSNNSD